MQNGNRGRMSRGRGGSRGHRNGGGGGRDGGGGGGRGGRGGGRYGRGGGRGGRGRGGRGRGGDRGDLLRSAESGNKRERIAIESGFLVLIDQFMLANPQLINQLNALVDSAPEAKDEIIKKFGGGVVELEPGTYRIERDPFAFSIVVHPEGAEPEVEEWTSRASSRQGELYVDTRCLAMVDRELLDDTSLLEKYQQLWFSGQDKACRDLLRDNGGAVRYGFQRNGDELEINKIPGENVVCLWPFGGPVKQQSSDAREGSSDRGSDDQGSEESDQDEFSQEA